jgi:RNA polymerase sigma factor (sigma-70 family)
MTTEIEEIIEMIEQEKEEQDEWEEDSSSPYSRYANQYYEPSFKILIDCINQIPLLTPEEEKKLAREIARLQNSLSSLSGKEKEEAEKELYKKVEKMVVANVRLVVKAAIEYSKKKQNDVLELSDLVQEGTLGLIEAAKKFDPDKGFRFSTYAYWWIKQTITRAIYTKTDQIRLPFHIYEGIGKIAKTDEILNPHLLAKKLPYSPDQVQRILDAMRSRKILSLNAPIKISGKQIDKDLEDLLTNPHQPSPQEQAISKAFLQELQEILKERLTEKERKVVVLRFGLDEGGERTLQEVGAIMGVSRERVRQIVNKALKKLRNCKALIKIQRELEE